uniref:Uncharacterized protein n=1 Tax=Timema tahoe TaxID=61484 RepID=A0A7R9IJE9_9NEOP|nr:unnamed protein product [Timema tahoe]
MFKPEDVRNDGMGEKEEEVQEQPQEWNEDVKECGKKFSMAKCELILTKKRAAAQIKQLWQLFLNVDAVQLEINPLVETSNGDVIAVDAKIIFDDNAKFRHKDIYSLEDETESDPKEIEAAKHNLNYIAMSGNIGCLEIVCGGVIKRALPVGCYSSESPYRVSPRGGPWEMSRGLVACVGWDGGEGRGKHTQKEEPSPFADGSLANGGLIAV